MIKRTLYFGNPSYLSMRNEQLVLKYPAVEKNENLPIHFKKEAETTIPIEDIGMVIIDHRQITITHDLCEKLIENNSAIVWCDAKHHPTGMTLPFAANDTLSEKTRYQIEASEPLKKQLWRQTIESKILNQAAVLKHFGYHYQDLINMSSQVLSGDTGNMEGRAAAKYWDKMLEQFETTRGRFDGPPNNFLNYAYAILRATVARNLVGSGLLPVLGIHHRNKYNAYCLANDIMEPYRPIIDQHIFDNIELQQFLPLELGKKEKAHILDLVNIDVEIEGKKSPLMVGVQRTTASVMKCFMGESRKISYPTL
ncbi:type II CRISPR-associated endonuclease Cas1 [Lacihabitans sp. LS3-19]|uniref:type II CRISPR-associated endonuclease Cas1 n=1 Tax=Lacihabitans sp. LS3-19 TaxID=2487335 RepID=UPI0020CB8B37|nr:type II CRISPR-associated endonuclease Cas1 [Lacihabitans sp. LS3-19]MCP9767412.1 type II CRISPR-associated endonuclease Cas1 [Lacihabitans sp. LS3-19]